MSNKWDSFESDLAEILNRHSMEELLGDTPDYIASEIIVGFMKTLGEGIRKRDKWYDRPDGDHVVDANEKVKS